MKRLFGFFMALLLTGSTYVCAIFGCAGGEGTSDNAISAPQKGVIFYHADYLGNSHLITDSRGNIIKEESRYPYGLERNYDEIENVDSDYVYTGKEHDEETGLIYFGARYYSPEMGRWISPDPLFLEGPSNGIEKPMSNNLYTYVRNNPTSFIDDDGFNENYVFFEQSPSERNIYKAEPQNIYENLFVETMAIAATGGVAGPLLADKGSIDVKIPGRLSIMDDYRLSVTDNLSLGVYHISSDGTTQLGMGSLGASISVTAKHPDMKTYGSLHISIWEISGLTLAVGEDKDSNFQFSVSVGYGFKIGPPVTASITPEGIERIGNLVESIREDVINNN